MVPWFYFQLKTNVLALYRLLHQQDNFHSQVHENAREFVKRD